MKLVQEKGRKRSIFPVKIEGNFWAAFCGSVRKTNMILWAWVRTPELRERERGRRNLKKCPFDSPGSGAGRRRQGVVVGEKWN